MAHRVARGLLGPCLIVSKGPRIISHRSLSTGSTEIVEDNTQTMEDVEEFRSSPPKGLASLRHNEGGNINRADLIGIVTELKLLTRLSKPDKEWATMFLRTRIPMLSIGHQMTTENPIGAFNLPFRTVTYHNRVHVFDRRLLPLVRRTKPGDRVFVTGFISYYKPNLTTSASGDNVPSRKIGAVVAERLVLLGPSNETIAPTSNAVDGSFLEE